MIYKTNDYGNTWTNISSGIPSHDYTRVIREDPARRGLLYAGTETGVYLSFDDGDSWQSLQANLPVVPVYDLLIKDTDLIAATHGRSFWIMDDLTQLHQVNDQMAGADLCLLKPRPAPRIRSPFRNRKPAPGKNYRPVAGAEESPKGLAVLTLGLRGGTTAVMETLRMAMAAGAGLDALQPR